MSAAYDDAYHLRDISTKLCPHLDLTSEASLDLYAVVVVTHADAVRMIIYFGKHLGLEDLVASSQSAN